MTQTKSDRLAGAILLAIAILWLVGVFWTIPEVADGARVGPRGFPLAMGVLLAGLSLFLIVSSFTGEAAGEPDEMSGAAAPDSHSEVWALAATFGFLALYVVLLDQVGFLIGTVAAVAGFLVIVLKRRSPLMVAAVSLGLALTIWLVLGKGMGVYLPRGALIDWF